MENLAEKVILHDDVLEALINKELYSDSVHDDKALQKLRQEVSDAIVNYETRIKEKCFHRYFAMGYEYCCEIHGLTPEIEDIN